MTAKTDEDAKGASTAEAAGKSPSADGQTASAGSAAPARVSLDDIFQSYFNKLYKALKKDIFEARDFATGGNSGAAGNSGELTGPVLRPPGLSEELVKSLVTKLETLEKNTAAGSSGGEGAPAGGGSVGVDGDLRKAFDELASRQTNLSQQVIDNVAQFVRREFQAIDGRLLRIEESIREPAAGSAAAPVAVQVNPQAGTPTFPAAEIEYDQWKEIILGEELCQDPNIADTRNRLFRGVLTHDDAAKALAGQMLLVQAATPDRLPPLMKDVGEAYYRWRPKTGGMADPFETALAAYLKRRCDAGGLGNTIELVVVGDRFDAVRHNASERGVTITAVNGWVVLRDNGKVYTKANVSVK